MTGAPAADRLPDPLLLVHGDEPFLVDRQARAWLRAARVASLSDLDVEIVDAPGRLDGLRQSLLSVPFLAARRHVLVRDAPQLSERARRGADSAEALAEAIGARSPTTSVCLVAHGRVAPSHPVVAAVRAGGGRIVEQLRPKGRDLRAAADRLARERGLAIAPGGLDHLVVVSGGDLGIIDSELAKVAAYAGDRRPIPVETVRRVAAGNEQVQIWGLLDRLLGPEPGRGAAALEELLAGGSPAVHLIGVLAGQLRELLLAHAVLEAGRGGGAVAAELGLPSWRADRLLRWARAVDASTAEAWLRDLQRIDAAMKLGLVDDAASLRALVLRAARLRGASQPRRAAAGVLPEP